MGLMDSDGGTLRRVPHAAHEEPTTEGVWWVGKDVAQDQPPMLPGQLTYGPTPDARPVLTLPPVIMVMGTEMVLDLSLPPGTVELRDANGRAVARFTGDGAAIAGIAFGPRARKP